MKVDYAIFREQNTLINLVLYSNIINSLLSAITKLKYQLIARLNKIKKNYQIF